MLHEYKGKWPKLGERVYIAEGAQIVGDVENVEAIAGGGNRGRFIHPRDRPLKRVYGRGRWRKMKGTATVLLPNGALRAVELHWYEAHGIGKRDLKIKRYIDE